MTSAVVAVLAGVLGLAIGRFWDRRSESSRWQRDRKYSEVLWAGMLTGGVGSLVAVTPLS
jgi:hypothetical protein